jgi:membrane protein
VLQKIRDLGLALAFGLVLVISAILSVVSTEALTAIFGLFGLPSDSFWVVAGVRTAGIVIVLALNTFTLGTMFRLLSKVAIPWRNLAVGSLLGAAALSGLSMLSGVILGHAGSNPLLASFTVIIGLLVYFNLVCRVILLAAAWIAIGMADRGLSARNISPEERRYEVAVAEHNARVIIARRDLEKAQARHDAARGIRRFLLGPAVTDARRTLEEVERAAPTPPARKKRFWVVAPDPDAQTEAHGKAKA